MNGSIDRRADRPRPWRARYTGLDRRQHSRSFRTKEEAERWLRFEIGNLDKGTWVDPSGGKRLYRPYAMDWLAGKLNLKEKTRHWYAGLLRSRVLPAFGDRQLRHIDPASVRSWIKDMADEGLSAARIRHAHQVLRSSLEQAVEDGLIGRNPADGASRPRETPREMLYLTAMQLKELSDLADAVRHGEGAFVSFLGYTGIRWSEAVALRRRSIDLASGRLQIKEAATDVGGKLVFGTPKSHRTRTLLVPTSVIELLETRLMDLPPDGLIFTAPGGGPLRSSNFRKKAWLPAINALAVAYPQLERLRVHDLRHSAASLAISCGANIKAVQRMLGHRTASMTLDRYGHLYDEDLVTLARQLDIRFQSVN